MRLIFGLVLLFGLGLAGFAVYMAQGYINQYETALAQERQARAEQVNVVDIYVAARPLRYGEALKPEDVKLIKFPQESLPEGVFVDEPSLFPDGNRDPRAVLRAIEMNEPILATKVTQPGQDAGVAAFLSPGRRAFTINVDVTSGVSGFLSPGDRVDVFWSGRIADQGVTKLIQSNVRIIAIDQSADQDRLEPQVARTVTVEVLPTEVAALAQAQSSGRLSLALVGVMDTDVIEETIEVNQNALLGIQEQVIVEEQEQRVCTINMRRGGELVAIPIPCTN